MTASVLKLDKDQLKWLLNNKDLFTKDEIKVAAKCLVQKNKRSIPFESMTLEEAQKVRNISMSNAVGIISQGSIIEYGD